MTTKVSICRRWTEPIPIGRDGQPIPKNLWPRRRKHVWVVRWFAPGPDGKIVRPSRVFPTREEAEKLRAEKATEFEHTPQTRRQPQRITLGEFIEEFARLRTGPRGQRLKAASLEDTRSALERFATFVGRDRPLVDVTPLHAVRFITSLRDRPSNPDDGVKQRSPATINKIKRTLKAAFNVAISPLSYMRENPFGKLKADRVADKAIRYVTPKEFTALMNAASRLPDAEARWWRAFLAVCYTAGLRYGEVLNLTWADVDFARDAIRVSSKKDSPAIIAWVPKDYEAREIPVPSETISLLVRLQEQTPEGHAYVFLPASRLALIKTAQAGGQWREGQALLNNFPRKFRAVVVRAALDVASLEDRSGEPTLSVHDLRRSAVTNWSKAANMQTVMLMAGHSNIETTRRYYAAATHDQLALVRKASVGPIRQALLSRQTDPKVTPKAVLGVAKKGTSGTKSLSNKTLRL